MEHRDKSRAVPPPQGSKAMPPGSQPGAGSAKPKSAAASEPADLSVSELNEKTRAASTPPDFDLAGLPDFADSSAAPGAEDPFAETVDPAVTFEDPFAMNQEVLGEPLRSVSEKSGADPGAAQSTARSAKTAAVRVSTSAASASKNTVNTNAVPSSVAPVRPATRGSSPSSATTAAPIAAAVVSAPGAMNQRANPQAVMPIRSSESDGASSDEASMEVDLEKVQRRKFFWTAVPSWAISLTVHVAILFVLAAVSLDNVQKVISVLQASTGDQEQSIDNFDLQGPTAPMDLPSSDEPISPPMVNTVVSMPELTQPELTPMNTSFSELALNSMTENVLPSAMMSSTVSTMKSSLNSRSVAAKSEMLERFGGNASSEKAVALALKWIADHQAPNGGWSFVHSAFCRGQCKEDGTKVKAVNGATAMALLPFLGAGQTHLQGQYKNTIKKGLGFLITNMKVTPGELPTGSWNEPDGTMYSHGLAAITICEAYAMTRDPDLLQPAQLSLNYLVYAQDQRGGGWRYGPKQPGDTSVVGWCLMALKSGAMGNLTVPPSTFRGASGFLDFVSTNNGAYYGYDKPTANIEGRQATIAVGLLCRMYLGWSKDNEALKEGVAFLDKRGPSTSDLYYSYYATQVMRHHGGPEWERWNTKLRDDLIKTQVSEGHAAGSWYASAGHGKEGGRLYATSLATMILEVYYRHMPLYSDKSSDDKFEL
jgi:hypothetical protein